MFLNIILIISELSQLFHIYSRFILENYSGTVREHICQNMNIEQF